MVTQLLIARGMPKASQADARYTPAGGRERCGGCRHFMAPSVCNRILGPVTAAGWCRYLSQKPPQRAANFPGMGPPGMSLDLPFMQPGALDPRIMFTRASTATYFNAAGVMQTAAANAPRWDYNPSTLALNGLLIEEARTNLWLQSADASNAAWQLVGITSAVPVVTGNQTTAPDGTLTAARVVYPAVNVAGSSASLLYQQITGTAAAYSFSVYLKGSVGGEQLYLGANSSSYINGGRITLTTAWQRFTLTGTLTAAAWFFDIGTDLRDVTQTATPAQTVYVWGAHLEAGAFPTSYIPTTSAAVTRATDIATMPTSTWYNAAACTLFTEAMHISPASGNGYEAAANINDGTANNEAQNFRYAAGNSYGGQIIAAGANVYTSTSGGIAPGVATKAALAWQSGSQLSALNGVTSNPAAVAPQPAAATTVSFGRGPGGVSVLNGYVRRVRYWPRVLSNAEMQAVTT